MIHPPASPQQTPTSNTFQCISFDSIWGLRPKKNNLANGAIVQVRGFTSPSPAIMERLNYQGDRASKAFPPSCVQANSTICSWILKLVNNSLWHDPRICLGQLAVPQQKRQRARRAKYATWGPHIDAGMPSSNKNFQSSKILFFCKGGLKNANVT